MKKYLLVCFFLMACNSAEFADLAVPASENNESPQEDEISVVDEESPLSVCSALSFEDVKFPEGFQPLDEEALAVALNITGSFEGRSGWTNLTNNFDGQGASMGLLNQNLGQGSLQPLFLKMRDNHMEVLKEAMDAKMLESFLAMLKRWENSSRSLDQQMQERQWPLVYIGDSKDKNVDKFYAVLKGKSQRMSSHNRQSVRWAKENLYKDKKKRIFKKKWKKALKKIAAHPTYISLQVGAAHYLHSLAQAYKDRLFFKELRSYLFLFDIAVQNGSIREKHFKKFFAWKEKVGEPSEEEQMLKLLQIRLADVNKRWRKDVRRRKKTIIYGRGLVHGHNRDLPKEYCYDQSFIYPN